jgi:phage baseplate assembly protein V
MYSLIYPGRIVEYFEATQTATVKICAERIFSNSEVLDATEEREFLRDVPVHTPSGGGWSMTVPINIGDTCILFFSQVGYDHWLYEDKDTAGLVAGRPSPDLRRQFSEDDGFALCGLNTNPRAIASYTMDGSQWRNSDATQHIHLKEDLSIIIDSPLKVTINAPAVEVNCTTATVDATASMDVTTPAFNVTSPLSTFSGLISCSGIGAGATPTAGKMSVTGTIDATGDITAAGISSSTHTHTEQGDGNETSTPN